MCTSIANGSPVVGSPVAGSAPLDDAVVEPLALVLVPALVIDVVVGVADVAPLVDAELVVPLLSVSVAVAATSSALPQPHRIKSALDHHRTNASLRAKRGLP